MCSLAAYGSTLPKSKISTPTDSVANNNRQSTPISLAATNTATVVTVVASLSPTPIPTATPSPRPTPIPTISSSSAILGGSINAFDKKFGANNCCYENGWTPPNGPYVAVSDDSYTSLGFDETSPNRVVRISMNPQGNGNGGTPTWDGQTASRTCNVYLPPDAVFQSGYQVFLANVVTGYTKVYYSALLAHTIPAKDFTDKNGNVGKPGTIYVYVSYNYDENNIGHCTLGIRGKDDLEY